MATRRPQPKDFMLADDPVWCSRAFSPSDRACLGRSGFQTFPSPVFQRIWELIARVRYGTADAAFRVAKDMGYIAQFLDPDSGELTTDLMRFDYDSQEVRMLLGLDPDMPLVFMGTGHSDAIHTIWDHLLGGKED